MSFTLQQVVYGYKMPKTGSLQAINNFFYFKVFLYKIYKKYKLKLTLDMPSIIYFIMEN